jgi:2-C-methyl-D-erythritol 4-phosphate cytidylyltransferase/2-C-methyl-D-erythritol 2,4-cyclodiphosphate synthase
VGEDAHSDGDVLIHALVDALLGAVGAGDIGTHFPDSDPRWKGQASRLFLERAAALVRERGMRIENIDAVVVLEEVKIGARKADISRSLREILAPFHDLPEDAVSVKAKTNERCDAIGEGRAIAAHVVVLLAEAAAGDPSSPRARPDRRG